LPKLRARYSAAAVSAVLANPGGAPQADFRRILEVIQAMQVAA
jgi:hypothetical protein